MNKNYFFIFIFLFSNNFGENEVKKAFAREIGNLIPAIYICYKILNSITNETSDMKKFLLDWENKLEKSGQIISSQEINKFIEDYNKKKKEKNKKKVNYGRKFMNFLGKAFTATILGSLIYYKLGDHKMNDLVKETLKKKWV